MLSIQDRIDYDTKYDVLYYSHGDTSNSYGDEIDNRLILLRDINTDNITGITVLDFMHYCLSNNEIINVMSKYFNIDNVLKKIQS